MFEIGMSFKVYDNNKFNGITGKIVDSNETMSLVAFHENGYLFGMYSVFNTTIENNLKYGSYKINK